MPNISPEQLHIWYLEAIQKLNPESFNAKAQKPYNELTEEQKFIDKYIADKVNEARNDREARYREALQYIVDHAWVNKNMEPPDKWINEFVDVAKTALDEGEE